MNVREMPSRVQKTPVVKGVFLGWLRDLPQGPGYACFVVTHDHQVGDLIFGAYLMRAAGLDKPWQVIESWENLTDSTADELFTRHQKLAVWPEGNKS